jgi:hypothetical protein
MEEEKKKLEVALFKHEPIRYVIHDNDFWYMWSDQCKILGINNKVLNHISSDMIRPFEVIGGGNALFVNQWSTATICSRRRKTIFKEWMTWSCQAMLKYDHARLAEMEHEKREAYFEARVTDTIAKEFEGKGVSYEWMYVFQTAMSSLTDAFQKVLHERGIDVNLHDMI